MKKIILIFLCLLTQNIFAQIPAEFRAVADSLLLSRIGFNLFAGAEYNCKKSGGFYNHGVWVDCPDTTIKEHKLRKKYEKLLENEKANYKSNSYWFFYNLRLNNSINYQVEFHIDTLGKFLNGWELNVPDCQSNPEKCIILIDSSKLMRILDSIGFDKGLQPWDTKLVCENNIFYWKTQNTKELSEYRISGEYILINAITGKKAGIFNGQWVRSVVK